MEGRRNGVVPLSAASVRNPGKYRTVLLPYSDIAKLFSITQAVSESPAQASTAQCIASFGGRRGPGFGRKEPRSGPSLAEFPGKMRGQASTLTLRTAGRDDEQ